MIDLGRTYAIAQSVALPLEICGRIKFTVAGMCKDSVQHRVALLAAYPPDNQ
jgi:hypothetical protein